MKDKSGDRKNDRLASLKEKIIGAISTLKTVRGEIGEQKFRTILLNLGADQHIVKTTSEVIRHFDDESGKFMQRYGLMMSIIGDDSDCKSQFHRAVTEFEPKRRGPKGGGLKAFSKELKQERDAILKLLKDYDHLRKEKNRLRYDSPKKLAELENKIPKDIRNEIYSFNYSDLAIKWMASYYPCSPSTLKQIIYYNPKNSK